MDEKLLASLSQDAREVRDSVIGMEKDIQTLISDNTEQDDLAKSFQLRLQQLEKDMAQQKGAIQMLQYVGGAIGGLLILAQVIIMALKG